MSTVEFRNVTRIDPQMDHPAVDGFDIDIADGELLVLVGPSDRGKSTVLRMLAGLEPVDAGRILFGGIDVTGVPPRERDVAMVFQAYALYRHMTMSENIAFHLLLEGDPPDEIRRRVDEVAELLGITELLHLKPSQLSGGQRQRVAMGRALIRHPPPMELYDEPVDEFVAGFIGSPAMNLLPAQVCDGVAAGIELRLSRRQIAELSTDQGTIGVRPEAWTLEECGGLRATVDVVEVLGADAIVYLSMQGFDRVCARLGRGEVTRDEQVHLMPRPGEVQVFDTATTKRIPA